MQHEPAQSYANHRSVDISLYVIALILLAAALCSGAGIVYGAGLYAASALLIVLACLGTLLRLRVYALRVQDRIIRLEMRLRLDRVLTGDLAGKGATLSLRQLIGLRYASDEELPELVRNVIEHNITNADDIKKLVKNWQADHLRV